MFFVDLILFTTWIVAAVISFVIFLDASRDAEAGDCVLLNCVMKCAAASIIMSVYTLWLCYRVFNITTTKNYYIETEKTKRTRSDDNNDDDVGIVV